IIFTREKAPSLAFTQHSNYTFEPQRTLSSYVLTAGPASKYSSDLDELISAAAVEPDFDKRANMYKEIQQHLYEDPAWIPLVNPEDIYGMQEDINWTPRRDTLILFNDIQ